MRQRKKNLEVIPLKFVASFLPYVLFYIETMATSREARINAQEALDFIFAEKILTMKILLKKKKSLSQVLKVTLKMN